MFYASRLPQVGGSPSNNFRDRREALRGFSNYLKGVASGAQGVGVVWFSVSNSVNRSAVLAGGVNPGAVGTVGFSINGVSITTTWVTSDTQTMTNLCDAINASTDPLVNGIVRATNVRCSWSSTGALAPSTGSCLGSKIDGIANPVQQGQWGVWQVTGVNSTDYPRMSECINSHPSLCGKVVAPNWTSAVSTMPVGMRNNQLPANIRNYVSTGAGWTIGSWVRSSAYLFYCPQRTVMGNAIEIAPVGANIVVQGSDGLNRTVPWRMEAGAGEEVSFIDYV